MAEKDEEPIHPANDELSGKVSYWDALKAEGFVPARVRKRVVVAEGYPEVPLTRHTPSQREE